MNEAVDRDEAFESRLDEALSTAPEVSLSPEFARRVAGLAPARPAVLVRDTGYARRSVLICTAVMLVALLLLAPRALGGTTLFSALEWILCAQLSLLALFSVSPWSPWRLRG